MIIKGKEQGRNHARTGWGASKGEAPWSVMCNRPLTNILLKLRRHGSKLTLKMKRSFDSVSYLVGSSKLVSEFK